MTTDLQTTVEPLDAQRVKLRVEVPEAALEPALADAYRRWAREIKVPGFRKGKIPRQIIDSRVGPDVVREEALQEALPGLYRQALEDNELEAIAAPDIELASFRPLVFEATVDLRPEIVVPDLAAITVDAAPVDVTESEVDEQLERLRDRFAELEPIGREARRGDYVLIDLKGSRHDLPVEGASAPDLLYEVGSRSGPPSLDGELEGARPGAILKFTDTMTTGELAGQEISFTVLVKEVKAKKLPPLDDEFARTVGELDSLDELRDELREKMKPVKQALAEEETRNRVVSALVAASDLEPPPRLVDDEAAHRLEHLESDLTQMGATLADYARETNRTDLQIRAELRDQAARSVKAELLLEEIARRERFEITDEDIGREIASIARRVGREPKEVAEQLAGAGRLSSLVADIMRRKAIDFVVANVNLTGRPVEEIGDGAADSGADETETM